jgi:S1-C subfamily serine protease
MRWLVVTTLIFSPGFSWLTITQAEETAISEARRTQTVQVIESCLPAVVSISAEVRQEDGTVEQRIGSGSVIHSAGFVLTNEHVVRNAQSLTAVFPNAFVAPIRVIATFAHEDLAIVQVMADRPLPFIELGRSHDLLLGEPTLVIGSPGGLIHSVSTGVVSGINRSTRSELSYLPWMVQTTAAVSGGNSGGPLLNALGEQIGVISSVGNNLQNVAFAIAIDHVREVLPQMLAMEHRRSIWLGLRCHPLANSPLVQSVDTGSPAALAGLEVGDQLLAIGKMKLRGPVDLQLALVDQQPGDTISLEFSRLGETKQVTVALAPLPLPEPVRVPESVKQGLKYSVYRGAWDRVPDFRGLQPERTGRIEAIDLSVLGENRDQAAVKFEGYLQVPVDDLYAFYLTSDDGSRLWINDRLLIDNDGLHATRESCGLMRLPAGYHRLQIEYFEQLGDEQLEVTWEHSQNPMKVKIPAERLSSDE